MCSKICGLVSNREPPSDDQVRHTRSSEVEIGQLSHDPISIARRGLQDIHKGIAVLGKLQLPPACVAALADILKAIRVLELGTGSVTEAYPVPWARPSPEEQYLWNRRCPNGGAMLRAQVCVAAEAGADREETEPCIGQLYISVGGLLFHGADDGAPLRTGFVRWQDVLSVERLEDNTGSSATRGLRIKFMNGTCALHLHIGEGAADAPWIADNWQTLRDSNAAHQILQQTATDRTPLADWNDVPSSFMSAIDDDDMHSAPSRASGARTSKRPSASREGSSMPTWRPWEETPAATASFSVATAAAAQAAEEARIAAAAAAAEALKPMSQSFIQVTEALPSKADKSQADFTARLPNATVQGIRAALSAQAEEDWPITGYLRDSLKVTELKLSKFVDAQRLPGTKVRRAQFRMPLPQEVPKAIAALVSVPETSNVTTVYRLGGDADECILVQQSCTHDVPFGENFRVQEVNVFRKSPDGPGVVFTKYIDVVWVIALSWTVRPVKGFLESKAKTAAIEGGSIYAKFLDNLK